MTASGKSVQTIVEDIVKFLMNILFKLQGSIVLQCGNALSALANNITFEFLMCFLFFLIIGFFVSIYSYRVLIFMHIFGQFFSFSEREYI